VEIDELDELEGAGSNATAGAADCESAAATGAVLMEEASERLTRSRIIGGATGASCCRVTGKEQLHSMRRFRQCRQLVTSWSGNGW